MLRSTFPKPPHLGAHLPATSLLAGVGVLLLLTAGCATTAGDSPAAAEAPAADAAGVETAVTATAATATAAAETATATAAAETTAAKTTATASAGGEAAPAADQKEWLVDPETGDRYTLEEVPKIEGYYIRQENNRVLLPFGAIFEIVDETDTAFVVKSWEPKTRMPLAAEKDELSEEERLAIVASYPAPAGSVDRVLLESFDRGLPRSGQWRNGLDLADMNGDGHLDIVFGPYRKSFPPKPNIFLGDSEGGWKWWEASYPEMVYDYGDVAAGDFDGDGHQDLALGMHLEGMVVLLGDGAGTFREWSEGISRYSAGDSTAFSSRAVDVVDWNGDGRLDIIALGEGPSRSRNRRAGQTGAIVDVARGFLVYLNQGDGTWISTRPVEMANESADFGDAMAQIDVDGDGLLDLVSATSRLGNTALLVQRQDRSTAIVRDLEGLRANALIDSLAVADLDEDGRQDLIVGYRNRDIDEWRGGIDVLWGRGDGGFERQGLWAKVGRFAVSALGTGEMDGQPGLDIVAATGEGEVMIFLGEGSRSFVTESSPELPAPQPACAGFGARLHDLDGDGRDEIVVGFAGEATGLPGISPDLFHAGCKDQGSLRVWTPRSVDAATPGD